MRLDTHQHFWKLAHPFTDWPTSDLAAIYRDFGPEDLDPQLGPAKVGGTILVQAAPAAEETEYLLSLARQCAFVKGVVGWIDFEAADAVGQIERLAGNPLLKGLRPMVQLVEEADWLLRPAFAPIFEVMARCGLRLDGLVRHEQIVDLAELARRHPNLPIILDHAGKPPIASGQIEDWARDITALAATPNAWCKLSGLWPEAGSDRSQAALQPYVDVLLTRFGPERLIWGSDWPVVELDGTYGDWLDQCEAMLSGLSKEERASVFGINGKRFYGIA